jgi:taurine dioxygenase
MNIAPIAGALGADVSGIDVTALSGNEFGALRDALHRYGVLAIRGQTLTPQQQLAFVKCFGDIHYHPHVQGLPEQPEVMEILKTETDKLNFGAGWHTDQIFLPEPANYTCLYALELPDAGGDTLYACMRNGFRTLSPAMQELVCRLHSENRSVASQMARKNGSAAAAFGGMRAKDAPADEAPAAHPLVRRHPDTGEPALYMGIHTVGLEGFSEAEAKPLIDMLLAHLTRPENTMRLRWMPGTLAIWDNRSVLHNAINDYQDKRRRMHRITVVGDTPAGYTAAA